VAIAIRRASRANRAPCAPSSAPSSCRCGTARRCRDLHHRLRGGELGAPPRSLHERLDVRAEELRGSVAALQMRWSGGIPVDASKRDSPLAEVHLAGDGGADHPLQGAGTLSRARCSPPRGGPIEQIVRAEVPLRRRNTCAHDQRLVDACRRAVLERARSGRVSIHCGDLVSRWLGE